MQPLFLGSFLSLFLDYDGGSRTGGIALPIEKDDAPTTNAPSDGQPVSTVGTLTKKVSRKLSGIFASRVGSGTGASSSAARGSFGSMNSSAVPLGGVGSPGVEGGRAGKRRTTSSAYGYDRTRGLRSVSRRESDATVRMERGDGHEAEATVEEEIFGTGRVGGFAERLLLASEGLGGGQLNDLWISQAIAQDQESVFESDVDEEEDQEDARIDESESNDDDDEELSLASPSYLQPSPSRLSGRRPSDVSGQQPSSPHHLGVPPSATSSRRISRGALGVHPDGLGPSSYIPRLQRQSVSGAGFINRRFSAQSARPGSIFAIGATGMHTPDALLSPAAERIQGDPFAAAVGSPAGGPNAAPGGGLGAIREGATASFPGSPRPVSTADPAKQSSPLWRLPLFLMVQYFVLCVHDTTNGQLFLSFLNTNYEDGGLGLNPAHFSALVAIMCLCQLSFQFYFYPRLGPPTGPLSHVAMVSR